MKSNLSSRQIHHLERRNTDACCSLYLLSLSCCLSSRSRYRSRSVSPRFSLPFLTRPSRSALSIRSAPCSADWILFPCSPCRCSSYPASSWQRAVFPRSCLTYSPSFLGNFTAGMPCAVIVTCLFYGAISGSAPATVAAVGSMTIPILSALGYDRTFSTGIVAVAGGLGVIIPPSIPFIMYGMASGASVSSLFLAGVIPGLMIGLLLMLYAIYHCRRYGEDREKIHAEIHLLHERAVPGAARKLFRSLKPGDHSWLYLQRHRLPHGSSGYLRFLCPVCQPVPLPDHEIPGYPADFCGSDPHSHRSSLFWQLPRHFPES